MEILEEDKKKIIDLYFKKFYSFSEIENVFKGKYSRLQIKSLVFRYLDEYPYLKI